jgi:catechol 2,3-dioxygenase-like lactoylglutathione lyase family enzyme
MTEARPVLDQVNVVVGDMPAAVAFYRLLGLEVQEPTGPDTPWGGHHRAVSAGEAVDLDLDSSAFARRWNAGWAQGATGAVIGFRVASRDAVDELYERLTAAGHPGQQPPYDAFWGARYAVVRDPAGNSVGIMSPADEAHRSEPPATPG